MKKALYFFSILTLFISFSCENKQDEFMQLNDVILIDTSNEVIDYSKKFKILSLGDSYTIGESVCEKCRFPEQLKDSLTQNFEKDTIFSLQVIANTGWTTTDLIYAVNDKNISSDFDLVTLLIGVNNQFMGKKFSVYENEFPALVSKSIKATNNNKNNVIVISIPDYSFTPLGQGNTTISQEIDTYNKFAKNYCAKNGITFVNITDITREGLTNPTLVASDNLHPSTLAYTQFVKRIRPLSLKKLRN
jgi:lysophospholipase L1-like esterase